MGWRGILIAVGLTIAFSVAAGLIASLLQAPALMLILAGVSFVAVGFATLKFSSSANPLEPAIGAAGTVLVFSLLQLAVAPGPAVELPTAQLVLSIVVAVFFAFSLAWVGGRLGAHRGAPPREASI